MSQTTQDQDQSKKPLYGLALAAIGVVYGDIGTSPLYTIKECFNPIHGLPLTHDNIIGVLSLVFWSLLMVVSLKYVYCIMRADNRGEGGILALMALATRTQHRQRGQFSIYILLGIFGASLFYGDGMITPAISVLSAVEGLKVIAPTLEHWVIPITITVLVVLFAMQSHGTATIGKLFAPIMVSWFVMLAVLGIYNIARSPEVLGAVSPHYAVQFLLAHPWLSFITLGAVVLALTGAEAIYADMGHFGLKPIRLGWFGFVWPALVLNYFGQGALVLTNPAAVSNPFYMMGPSWFLIPQLILATAAAVIASQAVISGAYSITWQAIQLGYCPRMAIRHTSEKERGQIYIPGINWALLAAVIVLVVGFQKSERLASAYGIAVTMTMVITSIMAFAVLGRRESILRSPAKRYALFALLALFMMIDLAFFSANAMKFLDGGWVPVVIASFTFFLMTTWKRGRRALFHRLHDGELPLAMFVESIEANPPHRVDGTAVFMTGSTDTVPHALLHNLKHNKVLHEQVVFLTIQSTDEPYVAMKERLQVEQLSPSFWKVVATYGFKEEPSVPDILALLAETHQIDFELMTTSFFLSRETIVDAKEPVFSWLRRRLFALMQRNAARPTDFFKIPPNRVVEMGTQIEM
ncbi:potassium transporter Kup [Chitinimonas lacunae]|uniref:Probable potassium transport system protein Kup n=1 Tax=Chitinimonas lacunae TaxID=1963018 RepID=A0ABV8MRM7_9NEIS